jgi:hypothetical protein
MVSYQTKKNREKEREEATRKKKTAPPFSLIPKIMLAYALFISFQ